MEQLESILNNIDRVKVELASAKKPQNIVPELVLATKTVPREILQSLAEYDKFIFGENRVQELRDKYFEHNNVSWHFIGQLQSNKVKYIIDKVALIHSVDRISLAKEIDRQALRIEKTADILVEVNVAGENKKGGIAIEEAADFIKELDTYPNIRVRGLMAVMPVADGSLAEYYLQLSKLYATIKKDARDKMQYLSAGMSGDYLVALSFGANMVRLGSAVFGNRSGGGYGER